MVGGGMWVGDPLDGPVPWPAEEEAGGKSCDPAGLAEPATPSGGRTGWVCDAVSE
jgi:hypothetical protein